MVLLTLLAPGVGMGGGAAAAAAEGKVYLLDAWAATRLCP